MMACHHKARLRTRDGTQTSSQNQTSKSKDNRPYTCKPIAIRQQVSLMNLASFIVDDHYYTKSQHKYSRSYSYRHIATKQQDRLSTPDRSTQTNYHHYTASKNLRTTHSHSYRLIAMRQQDSLMTVSRTHTALTIRQQVNLRTTDLTLIQTSRNEVIRQHEHNQPVARTHAYCHQTANQSYLRNPVELKETDHYYKKVSLCTVGRTHEYRPIAVSLLLGLMAFGSTHKDPRVRQLVNLRTFGRNDTCPLPLDNKSI